MGFFNNIGTSEITNEYKKAIKKLNAAIKRHPENLIDIGNDKLMFVRTRKRDTADPAFPFEGVTTYDIICKGIMDFLTHYNPGSEYHYYKLNYVLSVSYAFHHHTVNYNEDKAYPPCVLILEFTSNSRVSGVKYYVIDSVFNFHDRDLIQKAVALYYINTKK